MLLMGISLLTSCDIDSIEDISIIQIAGYDYIEEDLTRGTISVPEFSRVETGSIAGEKYYSATGETVKEIHASLQRKSSKPLLHGKISLTLFNEEIATHGIAYMFDNLVRDPSIGRDVLLAVVKGEAKDFIETRYSENERTSKYVTGLVRNNIKENFPKTNLHVFQYAYTSIGMDGFLPLLESDGKHAEIAGIAFFRDDLYVHSIPAEDIFVFKLMKEPFEFGNMKTDYKGHAYIIENIGSTVKYHVNRSQAVPRFTIDIDMQGIVNETTRTKIPPQPSFITKLENEIQRELQARCLEMIGEFQQNQTDPIGLGNVYKSRERKFDLDQWKEAYPSVPIDVKIDVKIVETGIMS
jgi:spore germination protein